MALLENIERTLFLGAEFLTWLWHRAESAPKITLEKFGDLRIEITDPLVLRGEEDHDAAMATIKGQRAGLSAEARTALREGKTLIRCRAIFKQGDIMWTCSLNADTLGFSSLSLPVPKGVPMPDGLILRGEKLEEFTQIYYAIFEQFLDLRLREKKWKRLEKEMRDWVTED